MLTRYWVSLGMLASMTAHGSVQAPNQVQRALAGDAAALAALRSEGPAGLERVLRAHKAAPSSADGDMWRATIDAVAGQRHASFSELYWYTDLDAAKEAAAASGRPILSLRLLGELTEEYSCANSRFFRAVLYSDPEISALMREDYILHWSSERAAPRLTIDLGNGQQIVRTITGNSAHYVLDSTGRPLDVLPGMYSPGMFEAGLVSGLALSEELDGVSEAERGQQLSRWHHLQLEAALGTLRRHVDAPSDDALRLWVQTGDPEEYLVVAAMQASVSKMMVEMPVLDELVPTGGSGSWVPDSEAWEDIGQRLYGEHLSIDANSLSLIQAQQPHRALPVEQRGMAMAAMLENFQRTMAADTARNELTMHARIHGLFVQGRARDLESLNRYVYDEMFDTPADDPWMGLLLPDVYTGLTGGGVQ